MAPIKFEEDIRDRLEKRQVQPSADAWQTLSNRLDSEPKGKSKKAYWWLGIAASFIGLIIVSSILFSKDSGANGNTPSLVEEDTVKTIKEEGVLKNLVVEEQPIKESQIALEELEKEEKYQKMKFIPNKDLMVETNDNTHLALEERAIKEQITKATTLPETAITATVDATNTIEAQKVDEVVAQIQKLQEEKSAVTDAEIDALLGQAQKELTSERLYNAATKTVDAELLLLQVETGLDQSFRNRVFEALNSGYKKVRTAVVDRNN